MDENEYMRERRLRHQCHKAGLRLERTGGLRQRGVYAPRYNITRDDTAAGGDYHREYGLTLDQAEEVFSVLLGQKKPLLT